MALNPVDPYDGSWKLGLDSFLPQFMELLFPDSYAEVDWSRSYQPLNSELQAIMPAEEAASSRRADALYQVWRRDGSEQWLILHFEVQTQKDAALARRMFVYAYRCFEKYGVETFGYAILGDQDPLFRPAPYVWKLGRAGMSYEFEAAKLADHRIAELEASANPAALLVLAHRFTVATRNEQERRRHFKLHLTRLLFLKGHDVESSRELFKVIDWMMRLVPEQAIIFNREVVALRKDPSMSEYVLSIDPVFARLSRQEGQREGVLEGKRQVLRAQLGRRFGELPAWASERLAAAEPGALERWSLQLLDAARLEDVFA